MPTQKRKNWTIRPFDLPDASNDPEDYVQALLNALSPTTRAVFFSHVGRIPHWIAAAHKLSHRSTPARGLMTIIDGANAPGHTG